MHTGWVDAHPETHPLLGPAPVRGTAISEVRYPAHPAHRTTPRGYPNAGQSLGPSASLGEGDGMKASYCCRGSTSPPLVSPWEESSWPRH